MQFQIEEITPNQTRCKDFANGADHAVRRIADDVAGRQRPDLPVADHAIRVHFDEYRFAEQLIGRPGVPGTAHEFALQTGGQVGNKYLYSVDGHGLYSLGWWINYVQYALTA